jgi:hypothetical protein
MPRRNLETLALQETRGALRRVDGRADIMSRFVVGVALAHRRPLVHHILPPHARTIRTEATLPKPQAERVYELFRRLYTSPGPRPAYNCFAALDFMTGYSDDIVIDKRVVTHDIREPADPDNLKVGEAYIIIGTDLADHHGMLAVSRTKVLHVAGPQAELGHCAAVELFAVWPGALFGLDQTHS